jgi:hypothetical protein
MPVTAPTPQVIAERDTRERALFRGRDRASVRASGVSTATRTGLAPAVRMTLRIAGWALVLAAVLIWVLVALHDAPA